MTTENAIEIMGELADLDKIPAGVSCDIRWGLDEVEALAHLIVEAQKTERLRYALDWLRMTTQDVGLDGETPVTQREHNASIHNANALLVELYLPELHRSAPGAKGGTR